ncbi:MAG: methionyl-tRNA formyltransferase [Steroidobacteraceae bacterium]
MRIAFAGTPEFAVPALRALHATEHPLVGVLTQPDRPAGRGRQLTASPLKRYAVEHGIAVAQPEKLATEEQRSALREWAPDLLVVVAYGLILPRSVLEMPRFGCVNIHGSLLPRWRGAAPIQRAILAGDTETGVTIMQMEAGLDTGPMLLRRAVPIRAGVVAAELHDELAELGAQLLLEVLPALEAGRIAPEPQPAAGVTYAAKLQKAEAVIDWQGEATQIELQVRAFNPWPVAETRHAGAQLRIWRARALPGAHGAAEPGTVLGLIDDALQVACGRGALAIEQLQPAGKRAISAREFMNAHPGIARLG